MPDQTIQLAHSLENITPQEWDKLAHHNPSSRYSYLYALEKTECVRPETGWSPHHLLLYRQSKLAAALPLYLKWHSRGEYVFDYAWARAFHEHGLDYYPKLLCAIPYTPVPGPRLLAHSSSDKQILLQAAIKLAQDHQLSSFHILFPEYDELKLFEQNGFMIRKNVQFHWRNQNYRTIEDFLASLTQKNRKKIRQSRRYLYANNIHFQHVTGPEISEKQLEFFYQCYCQTYIEHGNSPYLNFDFFKELLNKQAETLVLIMAMQNNTPLASAFFLKDETRLYGRYWGTRQFISGLHFETCYLQGIEYCIHNNLLFFEGGAQGEHKLARGMLPTPTYSAHWIRDNRYAQAIAHFLEQESSAIDEYQDVLQAHSPYKHMQT